MKTIVVTPHLLMFARQSCYAALLLGCLTRLVAAQEPASTQSTPTTVAPIYKVGDTWTFLWGKTDTKPGVAGVQTVVSVTEDQTTLSVSTSRGPLEVDFNNQGDLIRKGSTAWEHSLGWLSFPMAVGKRWDSRHVTRYASGGIDASEHVEVVAFERVQVTAGSFDAYKIVIRGVSTPRLSGGSAVPFTATWWYAPSVKRVIKENNESYVYHHINIETGELAAFSLAH